MITEDSHNNENIKKEKNNIENINKRKDLWKFGLIENLKIENGFKGLPKDEQNKRNSA